MKQWSVIAKQDYLEIFRYWSSISRRLMAAVIFYTLRWMSACSHDKTRSTLTSRYSTTMRMSISGQPNDLSFRKQTLLHLMRSFMSEVAFLFLDAGRVLRYALKIDWAKENVLMQADGYFKMHMPVDLTDKRTTYAVAIKLGPVKQNEVKDAVEIGEITTVQNIFYFYTCVRCTKYAGILTKAGRML